MLTVVFWNLAKNSAILPHVGCLAAAHDVDAFFLAESPPDLTPGVAALNLVGGKHRYREEGNGGGKIRAGIAPTPADRTSLSRKSDHLAVWSVRTGSGSPPDVLIAVVPLPGKTGGTTSASQTLVAGSVAAELAEVENRRGHANAVVVGDFNMNPFDEGMTHFAAFHAFMTKDLAGKRDRGYNGRTYRRLYNPMWGLFGDRTPGPAGSHYWGASQPHNAYWHMLDQVLLRPALVDRLTALEVLDDDGRHVLVGSTGHPEKEHLSDHLPILVRLDV